MCSVPGRAHGEHEYPGARPHSASEKISIVQQMVGLRTCAYVRAQP